MRSGSPCSKAAKRLDLNRLSWLCASPNQQDLVDARRRYEVRSAPEYANTAFKRARHGRHSATAVVDEVVAHRQQRHGKIAGRDTRKSAHRVPSGSEISDHHRPPGASARVVELRRTGRPQKQCRIDGSAWRSRRRARWQQSASADQEHDGQSSNGHRREPAQISPSRLGSLSEPRDPHSRTTQHSLTSTNDSAQAVREALSA